eukprot:3530646-Prymnesium_polylepis.1
MRRSAPQCPRTERVARRMLPLRAILPGSERARGRGRDWAAPPAVATRARGPSPTAVASGASDARAQLSQSESGL